MKTTTEIRGYSGRVFEAKDNFGIESIIGKNHVSLENPSDFIDHMLSQYNNKNISIEVIVNIKEID
jgi:hypothetical protein